MFRKFLLTAVVAVAAAMVAPATSRADFTLTLSDGTNSIVIDVSATAATVTSVTGNLVGVVAVSTDLEATTVNTALFKSTAGSLVSDGTNNATIGNAVKPITFEGATFNVTGGSSNFGGTTTLGTINVNVNDLVSNTTSGTLKVTLTESGFTLPSPATGYLTGSTNMNPATGSQGNTLSSSGLASYGPGTTTTQTIASSGNGPVTSTGTFLTAIPYQLGAQVTISGTAGSELTTVGETTDLVTSPAPSGLIVAATMVPFFGLLRRRLRGMATAAPVVA